MCRSLSCHYAIMKMQHTNCCVVSGMHAILYMLICELLVFCRHSTLPWRLAAWMAGLHDTVVSVNISAGGNKHCVYSCCCCRSAARQTLRGTLGFV
jgi:hypothetical protein